MSSHNNVVGIFWSVLLFTKVSFSIKILSCLSIKKVLFSLFSYFHLLTIENSMTYLNPLLIQYFCCHFHWWHQKISIRLLSGNICTFECNFVRFTIHWIIFTKPHLLSFVDSLLLQKILIFFFPKLLHYKVNLNWRNSGNTVMVSWVPSSLYIQKVIYI